ncbi:MAG TPA: chemotaxis protein CheA [Planctomycetota bacterium]|jgi:two-component system chemotaxis sensor kinase CheA
MPPESEHLEILRIFLCEANDLLDSVEPRLIEMQQASTTGALDPETLNAIFRAFHSIKGSGHSLRLKEIGGVAHHAESLLDIVRKGNAAFDLQYATLLLKSIDLLRSMLRQVEKTHSDAGLEPQKEALLAEFNPVLAHAVAGPPPAPSTGKSPIIDRPAPSLSAEIRDRFVQEADELLQQAEQCLLALHKNPPNAAELIAEAFRSLHSLKGNCGFIGLADLESVSHRAETVLQKLKSEPTPTGEQIQALLKGIDVLRSGVAAVSRGVRVSSANCQGAKVLLEQCIAAPAVNGSARVSTSEPPAIPGGASGEPPQRPRSTLLLPADGKTTQVLRNDIRVDLTKLDSLINLVGELVIAESMVTRNPVVLRLEDESLERAVHHLRRVLTDLQDVSMVVRMIPLSSTFRKMMRVVHDLSTKMGKQVKLDLIGEDTEVDKSVIELLSDPLVHILRNALDHGIETPEERIKSGKTEVGTVKIEAKHESGEVLIIISDDGRGMDRGKILAKAMERGLVRDPNGLRDREILNLIFEPGFSTAEKITDVSGRGVGMDVVKKNMEKLKGRIELHSKFGMGSTVVLRIPLTLAIMDGMLVRVGTARYTLPMSSIRETFRPVAERVTLTPDAQELVRVRDELIPVVRLHRVYQKKPDSEKLEEGILIVVEGGSTTAALFVDEILGQQQTVIKGLSEYLGVLGGARGVSGCTILGDGEVSLILDVRTLVMDEASSN